jgi:hypothetical protein
MKNLKPGRIIKIIRRRLTLGEAFASKVNNRAHSGGNFELAQGDFARAGLKMRPGEYARKDC